jgi:hypothetical protein
LKFKLLKLSFAVFVMLMCALQNNIFAQARIVFGTASDAYMVMGNTAINQAPTSIYLVIGDATAGVAANTITRAGFGRIITNSENNVVKWYIGTNTGTYTIPWGYDATATTYIPFTFDITSAGGSNSFVNFSTYRTASANNQATPPTGVTNDWSSACACNASVWMVDRYWQLDNTAYGAVGNRPSGALTFYYVDNGAGTAEVLTAGQSLVAADEANLQAESYNNASGLWTGNLYGTDTPGSNKVDGTGNIATVKLDKWWTLVEKNHPLPVTWLHQSAECNGGAISIKWSTSSEQNSDFFTVEKSVDGTNFTSVTNVIAAGNSSTVRNYSAIDLDPYSGVAYYRIRETDFNSSYMTSEIMTVTGCSNDDVFVYGSEGGISVNINSIADGQYNIELYDMLGQRIMNEIKNVSIGDNHLKLSVANVASAMYIAKVYNSTNAVTKKVFIRAAYTQ